MFQGKYIFSQLIEHIIQYEFDKCVKRYKGNQRIRNFDCRDQFLAMIFGQLTNLRSLRGIVLCLNAHTNLLYHLGFKSNSLTLSTLARANEKRDFRIYYDPAQILIKRARELYIDDNDFKIELDGAVYALDSTVIDLCLATFKWARFEKNKSAVKIHTQLDLRGNIPSFFWIIMDRGYFDFARLWKINLAKAFFVIRSRSDLSFKRIYSAKVDKSTGLYLDQTIKLKRYYPRKNYPEKLRRLKYYDKQANRRYTYLTNNFEIDGKIVADLYKHRWQIELFFKWIKQHLRIEVFWGYSANAVKTQICIALCTFLLVAIMKKKLNIERNLYEILQILSVSQFEKTPINTLVSEFNLQICEDQAQKRLFSLDF